jgi:hypothetical protein
MRVAEMSDREFAEAVAGRRWRVEQPQTTPVLPVGTTSSLSDVPPPVAMQTTHNRVQSMTDEEFAAAVRARAWNAIPSR